MLLSALFALMATSLAQKQNSIVMTMIVRDEEVNIRSNLPLWIPLIKYFVFMVDRRTSDETVRAIDENLKGKREYHIEMYEFDGFGPARTASLQTAWKYFSQATHVWIADPDWKPEVNTINLADLDTKNDAFRFLIYDRNGHTTRRCDWLLRHRPGLAMRYHLHEVLSIGETYEWKVIEWVLREIEQTGSWHTTVGHSSSHASKRYIFDLSYLEKDLETYGWDPHTHYYLGVTHHAYIEALLKEGLDPGNGDFILPSGRTYNDHLQLAIKYLKLRATSEYRSEFLEERWGVMFLLGGIYSTIMVCLGAHRGNVLFSR